MALRNGKRCRLPARIRGLCGIHSRVFKQEWKTTQILIRDGKFEAAGALLIKFGLVTAKAYNMLLPIVEDVFSSNARLRETDRKSDLDQLIEIIDSNKR